MAGDWIKIDISLPEKPEIWQIAGMTGIDPDAVVGKLIKVWRWFDSHTENGNAVGVTYALVDYVSGVTGFAEAMALCGWLEQAGMTLTLPNFDRHNGKTAKNRALTAKRVASHKAKGNDESNAPGVSGALPREEKRREEKKEQKPIERQAARFGDFWAIYPNKKGKADAEKAWTRKKLDALADTIIADVKARAAQDRQWLDGYIPHGSTYVNAEGWQDAIEKPRQQSGGYEPMAGEI